MFSRKPKWAIAMFLSFCLVSVCGLTAVGTQQIDSSIERRIDQGSVFRQRGEFQQAISMFESALELVRIKGDSRAQLECLMNLGILYWNIGQVKDSDDIYRQALRISRDLNLKEREDQCAAYIKIYESYIRGKETRAKGLCQESIAQFSLGINLARKMKSPEHELKCLRQMSLNYDQLEDFAKFYILNKAGLEIAQRINHKKEKGRCLNNMGIFFYNNGDYSRALMCFDEALAIMHESSENKVELSACLNNIGLVYRELGLYGKAFAHFEMALEMDQSLNNEEGVSINLSNIGAAYHRKGKNSGNPNDILIALSCYLKSFEMAKNVRSRKFEVDILNNIGLAYSTLGQDSLALRYFQSAIKEADEIKYLHEKCNVASNCGYVLAELGLNNQAQAYFKKSIDIAAKIGNDEVIWEAYIGLGECFKRDARYDSALACYKKAITVVETLRSRVALDDYKAGFIRDKMKAYEALLNLLYDRKEKEKTSRYDTEIFEVVERAKARSFLEELENGTRYAQDSYANEYREEQAALSKRISLTISELIRSDLDEALRKGLLARLENEEDAYTSLLNRIKTIRAEHSQLSLPRTISAQEIQENHLGESSAILEFYLGEKRSFGILLTKDGLIIRALPSRAEVEDSLRAFLKMLSTPPSRKFLGIGAGRRIYGDLIFPFEHAFPKPLDHLVIIPDGILNYLPFETLVRDDAKALKSQYLVELHDVSYAPSASSLAYLKEKKRTAQHRKALLAVGAPTYLAKDNMLSKGGDRHENALRDIYLNNGFELTALPYSKKEIHRVARCFPDDQVDLLTESQAKEEVIKSWPLEDYRILHFACHGFLDERTSMRSALVLALDDDPEEDGFLQAREISDLRLDADLVVLSACQTGKGRLENAEGVLGLPRTLFYAGARSVISSLWKINDKSTASLMPEFYRYLAAGNNKAQSLRLAKLKMLGSRFSHPFYWAAFVLNGDYLSGDP